MNHRRSISKAIIMGAVLAGGGAALLAAPALAKVQGQCAECHTMHNSQGGNPMAVDASGAAQSDPNDVLLVKGCVACHTGTNDGNNNIPYVNSTTAPDYSGDGTQGNTLAGGNFYWVANGNDAAGHNVTTDSLAGIDGTLGNTPPGNNGLFTGPLTCAGTTGCHGDRSKSSDFAAISGAHHGNDATIDGTTVATSYRFLLGVKGLEDSDWEFQPTATTHNQYYGIDRTSDATADIDSATISALCAQCHNNFHNGIQTVGGSTGFGSPWVRHPTDYDMGNTAQGSEYRGYGGAGNTYEVTAPVASANVNTVLSSVTFSDDSIVTCVSCHRAHGTPNADLLRWDYSQIKAGGGGSGGCFKCHTTKM